MHARNSKKLWHLFLLIVVMALYVVLGGCSDSDIDFTEGWEMPGSKTYEYEVGPEGDVLVVEDHSSIHGLTLVIPEGALARNTTIKLISYVDAPDLPDGLDDNYHPAIEFISDAPFLKEIEIKFPSIDTPENTGKMLCAFYWDGFTSSWQVVMPESFENNLMIVKTQDFSYWQWGEVILEEVEIDTLNSFMDKAFGPDYIAELAKYFEIESAALIDWDNVYDYCANKSAIAQVLTEINQDSKISAEEGLQLVNDVCKVWDHDPVVSDIYYGFEELIQIHVRYFVDYYLTSEIIGTIPYVGGVLGVAVKASAEAVYDLRLGNLKDQYKCILTEAESTLWINIGGYYMADAALLGMQLMEIEYPCN